MGVGIVVMVALATVVVAVIGGAGGFSMFSMLSESYCHFCCVRQSGHPWTGAV